MATARPFAYNTGSTITGTVQVGNIAIGTPTAGFDATGLEWWNGPDEDLGYVICYEVPDDSQPTPVSGVTASIQFWRSNDKTEASFIEISEYVTNQSFVTGDDASNYLTTNGYWNSWIIIPPSPTPTPTSTVTPTPTPTITPTNTPTPTVTLTPTPSPTVQAEYVTYSASTSNLTTYSFNGISIGGAGLIVLTIGVKRSVPEFSFYDVVSSIVVNGSNANIHTERGYDQNGSAIASIRITGGTTANIDVNLPYTGNGLTLAVHRITNNVSDTPLDSGESYLATVGETGDYFDLNFPTSNSKILITTVCSTVVPSATASSTTVTKNFQVNNASMSMASGFTKLSSGTNYIRTGWEMGVVDTFISLCGSIWN